MMALDDRNRLWSWGGGAFGQIGNGDFSDSIIPTMVSTNENDVIVDIACGGIFF
jgi:alpha-tubulin suppressor-like RCC1 family protein